MARRRASRAAWDPPDTWLSTEAEVRESLASAVKPETRVGVGDAIAALGRSIGLTNEDVEIQDRPRDKTRAEPRKFE